MKKINIIVFALFWSLAAFAAPSFVRAQNQAAPLSSLGSAAAPPPLSQQNDNQPAAQNFNLRQLLNLTADQIQQIRLVNQQTRENVRAANTRQRAARRALDSAIYADAPNQTEVEARARALAEAQSEAIKTRADVEFRIRQILTPEQLIRFRDLRLQFEQKKRQRLLFQQKFMRRPNNKPL